MVNLPQMPEQWPQNRSSYFVLAIQIDALCHALKTILTTANEFGSITKEFIKAVCERFGAVASGVTIEHLPVISNEILTADAYIAAALLRATVCAFVSPEEIDSRSKFGFASE